MLRCCVDLRQLLLWSWKNTHVSASWLHLISPSVWSVREHLQVVVEIAYFVLCVLTQEVWQGSYEIMTLQIFRLWWFSNGYMFCNICVIVLHDFRLVSEVTWLGYNYIWDTYRDNFHTILLCFWNWSYWWHGGISLRRILSISYWTTTDLWGSSSRVHLVLCENCWQ